MISFNRKLALNLGGVAVLLAALVLVPVWWLARENAEDTFVSLAVEETHRLMQQEAFRPGGPQAPQQAQAAALALTGSQFDIVDIYNAAGGLLAHAVTPAGRALEQEIAPAGPPSYQFAYFESRRLPGERRLWRVFVPLRDGQQTLLGYVEGARLLPRSQHAQIEAEAWRVTLWVMLAMLLTAAVLYLPLQRLMADGQRKTREALESHMAMMEALGRAIARRDSDDGGTHNYRVAWIAATLGEAVGLHGSRMQALIAGSFLHDVGKIGIPDTILLKPGRLDEDEMRVMRTHVGLGEDIVAGAGWLAGGQAVVAGHHEKWDGTGYPRGLAGEDIPLVARIFALADVFDTLCARRPYKAPLPLEAAMQALQAESGRHFDPHLVKVFAGLSQQVYRTIVNASEADAKALLEQMVRKHFE